MFDGYYSSYIYVLIPLILSIWASSKVNSTFNRYSKVYSARGFTAAQVTRMILDNAGLRHVGIERVSGNLTDHFDPRGNVIRLSDTVYDSTSVAAIGVAAHEAGHAQQYRDGYLPIKLRSMLVPIANLGSQLAMPLLILGLVMSFAGLVDFAIWLYVAVVAFSVVTLPVEFNASSRALKTLEGYGILSDAENRGAKKVLSAAAMTYVASTLAAIGSLLRLLAISGRRRD